MNDRAPAQSIAPPATAIRQYAHLRQLVAELPADKIQAAIKAIESLSPPGRVLPLPQGDLLDDDGP